MTRGPIPGVQRQAWGYSTMMCLRFWGLFTPHKGLCSHFQPFNTLCLLLPPSPPYSRLLSGHWHAETFSCLTAAWAGLCSHIEQRSLGNVFEKCFKLIKASGGVGGTPRCWVMLYKRYHALFFFCCFFLWACLVWGKRKENSVRAKQSWRGRVKTNKSSSCLWYRLPSSRLYHYFATAVPGPSYSSDTPSESSCYSSELSMTSSFTESWHLEHAGLTVVVEMQVFCTYKMIIFTLVKIVGDHFWEPS